MVTENKEYLDLKVVLIMVLLTMLWGFNCTAVKYSNQGLAPVFTSALRSVIASIGGVIYCVRNKEGLFHTDKMLFYEFMVGLLFGLELACSTRMQRTQSSSSTQVRLLLPWVPISS